MKKILATIFIVFAFFPAKADLLFDLLDGKYKAQVPEAFRSLNDGEHFTQLIENKYIVKYNFRTGNAVDTIFNVSKTDFPYKTISDYSFNDNEKKLLVLSRKNFRYRRTFTSDYYVCSIENKSIKKLSENGEQEAPLISPDGKKVAFARGNNLFIKDLETNTEKQITTDGKFNEIINGTPDWVYEEEFDITRLFMFSPDSKYLVYVKFDESKVPLFSMMKYLNNNDSLLLYPRVETFKYPKPGENISKVSVHQYDIDSGFTFRINLDDYKSDFYIPRIKWTNQLNIFSIFVLNRHQNKLDMIFVDTKNKIPQLVFSDNDKYYVDYENIDKYKFLNQNKELLYLSEKDGFRHAYLFNVETKTSKPLTRGAWDITKVYGFDEKSETLFYQSAEKSPLQRDIYAINTKGQKKLLTDGKGTHNADFSSTFSYFADNASSVLSPNVVTLRNNKGNSIRELVNNKKIAEEFFALKLPQKEFFSFKTSENVTLNGWIIKPKNMTLGEKYPLLMVQYSGPNSQQVLDNWKTDWEYYLADQGYAVACVDGRGTGARGAEFRKCTYQNLGVLETKDQIEAAKYLGNLPFVDKNRIGIWGWSYGGYMVMNTMSTGENFFKAGISVAPVTDWRLYNAAYTERFMRTPQEDSSGYDAGSALENVSKLNGNLLVIHGTADDNVHLQNTMIYLDKAMKAEKQIQLYTYTDKNHSILGKETRRHLYLKKFRFLEEYLKKSAYGSQVNE